MDINCGIYKDNAYKGAIDWVFSRILKYRAENIMPVVSGGFIITVLFML